MRSICLIAVTYACTAAAVTPAPALCLRGGGVLSALSDKLGWKRDAVGSNELGCGPLPQVKPLNRHTNAGLQMNKAHDGSGYTRSHSVVIPDVTGEGNVAESKH